MTIWRILIVGLFLVLGKLVDHAYEAFSPGAAKLVMLGTLIGVFLMGAVVMDLLGERKRVP